MKNKHAFPIFIIKNGSAIYWCLIAIIIVFFVIDAFLFKDLYLFFLLSLVSTVVIVTRKSVYKFAINSIINKELYENCDPEGCINVYSDLVSEKESDIKAFAHEDFNIDLSSAFLASGKYREAYDTLYNEHYRISESSIAAPSYFYNLLIASLELGLTDEAEKHLDRLIKETSMLSGDPKRKYGNLLMLGQYSYNIAIGRFDYADRAFTEAFDKATNNYERVRAKFWLGKVFLHNDNLEGARESFEYVIANGNKLYVVEEAKALLNGIA